MQTQDFERLDRELATGRVAWTRDLAIDYAQHFRAHPLLPEMERVKAISMLGVETLVMCRGFALASRSGVLEIGPYIGGSTIALGMGLREAGGARLVSIDVGGSNPDQPHLPSSGIHDDWRRNVDRAGLAGIPQLIAGFAQDQAVIAEVRQIAGRDKFDVLFVDSDGQVQDALRDYGDLITDDCLLIFDDYYNVQGVTAKTTATMEQIHSLMRDGLIEQYVLTPWSTWLGRRVPQA